MSYYVGGGLLWGAARAVEAVAPPPVEGGAGADADTEVTLASAIAERAKTCDCDSPPNAPASISPPSEGQSLTLEQERAPGASLMEVEPEPKHELELEPYCYVALAAVRNIRRQYVLHSTAPTNAVAVDGVVACGEDFPIGGVPCLHLVHATIVCWDSLTCPLLGTLVRLIVADLLASGRYNACAVVLMSLLSSAVVRDRLCDVVIEAMVSASVSVASEDSTPSIEPSLSTSPPTTAEPRLNGATLANPALPCDPSPPSPSPPTSVSLSSPPLAPPPSPLQPTATVIVGILKAMGVMDGLVSSRPLSGPEMRRRLNVPLATTRMQSRCDGEMMMMPPRAPELTMTDPERRGEVARDEGGGGFRYSFVCTDVVRMLLSPVDIEVAKTTDNNDHSAIPARSNDKFSLCCEDRLSVGDALRHICFGYLLVGRVAVGQALLSDVFGRSEWAHGAQISQTVDNPSLSMDPHAFCSELGERNKGEMMLQCRHILAFLLNTQ